MLLSELASCIQDEVISLRGDAQILDLFMDSRKTVPQGLFFCISGARFDAHEFADQAIANGACALVVERILDKPVPQLQVRSCRAAMSGIASAFFGRPADSLRLFGITGTKGKTTTSYLIKSILEAEGLSCGLIGTTGNMIGDRYLKSEFTTPEPIDLHRTFRQMVDEGVQAVSMEISAHAIEMGRLEGLHFEVGGFTNLSQDHLDLFGTMDRYFECKKSFFTPKWLKYAAVNVDDDHSAKIIRDIRIPCLTYGICVNADLYARDIEISEDGVSFTIVFPDRISERLDLRLTGMFNVYNALSAAAMCIQAGISKSAIIRGLEAVRAVPGRAEVIETDTPYKVILDYSHSPDALENILKTVREFARGRVIAVFGCGGDRDKLKRPIMGEISGRLADYSILTSDNPRSEDPFAILSSIEEGIKPTGGEYCVIENRREAIRHALKTARQGDVIVLAGKGHETYQEIRGVKRPFNEKTVVRELLLEESRRK